MSQVFIRYSLFIGYDSGIIPHQNGTVYTILSETTGILVLILHSGYYSVTSHHPYLIITYVLYWLLPCIGFIEI